MDIYSRKRRWKIVLSILGLLIISASIFYTNLLVRKFAAEERKNVRLWADAVQRKARLVRYTESFFGQLQEQERKRVELLANVYKQLLDDTQSEYTFYLEVISNNNTVPVILADYSGRIIESKNLGPEQDTIKYLRGKIKEDFSVYKPITVQYLPNRKHYLYYKDSRFFTELRDVLSNYVASFMSEVALNSSSVPVIITDSTHKQVLMFGNLNDIKMTDPLYVETKLEEMADENAPIKVAIGDQGPSYIYYQDSELLTIIKYFPLTQILIIAVFAAIAYLLFSFARRSEQNRVWAGMARETAHQIGTPLSSIMAWLELIKIDENNVKQATTEIEKDVQRLEMITERFSKIGSSSTLENTDLIKTLDECIAYLKPRTPKKIKYILNFNKNATLNVPVNAALFSWVIENLCKNAIDAMGGNGSITIDLSEETKNVIIDISDIGKGISTSEQKAIFNPGYTSKKRGWGLGLSLSRRIINDYHKGKLYVKSSTVGKGTTFRIILKKVHMLANI
ncbi:MAG: HAMP domain-containing histidine kinase [Bacteroidetes bacterium]|nr:HAMP domain-containing histidine kinase [Bacteroidota bacterium]MBL6944529.1 HAMP domain-containing histidine kinase [Bacteroidales bacterium]